MNFRENKKCDPTTNGKQFNFNLGEKPKNLGRHLIRGRSQNQIAVKKNKEIKTGFLQSFIQGGSWDFLEWKQKG